MLKELLALIAAGKPMTTEELALRMDARPAELAAALEILTRRGYLVDLRSVTACGASGACAGCPARRGCHDGEAPKMWSLTEKGRRAAVQH